MPSTRPRARRPSVGNAVAEGGGGGILKVAKMRIEIFIGVEVTFAAILAAQECGDFEAIEAAKKGGTEWDAYLTGYITRFAYRDFALAPLTKLESADLRSQVLEQSACLPHKPSGSTSAVPNDPLPHCTHFRLQEMSDLPHLPCEDRDR